MGFFLGPASENIIMTEVDKGNIETNYRIRAAKILYEICRWYSFQVKENNMNYIFYAFSSICKNPEIILNHFEDSNFHFLGISIDNDLHYKSPYIEQFFHFNSSFPWNYKTSFIKSPDHRASKENMFAICEQFISQIDNIRLFML